jgi:hypothetical protein
VGAEPLGYAYYYCDTSDWTVLACAGASVTDDRPAHNNAPIRRRWVLTRGSRTPAPYCRPSTDVAIRTRRRRIWGPWSAVLSKA